MYNWTRSLVPGHCKRRGLPVQCNFAHIEGVFVPFPILDQVTHASLYAYIDPGSTSFLLQVIVGGVAALIVVARAYWRRTIDFVRRGRDSDK